MNLHGKPVIDAYEKLVIEVLPTDIKGSKIKDAGHCAAARAICRQEHAKQAEVYLSRAYVLSADEEFYIRYVTSSPLRTELAIFDRRGRFEPGKYALLALQPSSKLGANNGGRNKETKKRKKPRSQSSPRKYHILTGVRHKASNVNS